ncbi:hypothetical protein [Brevundimonas sp. Root1423]|uniref:hypothetical protein n=1 Tax=Brevundimonas sp. Root1423 TaxID=1736462 RepID=UPI0006FC097C|nr:hypothetical protein [Brevundimonas sp. Root1423]KQY84744.1 hypothetical protein ASD25_06875 [Brevundimonas sp. Root1423]
MTSVPAYPATDNRGESPAYSPLGERRAYAAPYESLTFSLVTRAGRELAITLAAQPVFDLDRSIPVSRRIRRIVRHRGGESALAALGRRTLEPTDLKRIDLQTLNHGLELLHLGPDDVGVLPAFWRTVSASRGRFALLCTELQQGSNPGNLLIEVMGGLEQAQPDVIDETVSHFEKEAMGVILHIAPDPGLVRRLAGVRARCLAIDFAGVAHDGPLEWRAAHDLIAAARQTCDQVMLLNLRPDRGLAAQAAGATHAVFAGMDAITV